MQQDYIQSTYKSNDTEEWLDRIWTRPIGYAWACLFRSLHVHPNVVTVLSMLIGASFGIALCPRLLPHGGTLRIRNEHRGDLSLGMGQLL